MSVVAFTPKLLPLAAVAQQTVGHLRIATMLCEKCHQQEATVHHTSVAGRSSRNEQITKTPQIRFGRGRRCAQGSMSADCRFEFLISGRELGHVKKGRPWLIGFT
jgi:hypothetical protein